MDFKQKLLKKIQDLIQTFKKNDNQSLYLLNILIFFMDQVEKKCKEIETNKKKEGEGDEKVG